MASSAGATWHICLPKGPCDLVRGGTAPFPPPHLHIHPSCGAARGRLSCRVGLCRSELRTLLLFTKGIRLAQRANSRSREHTSRHKHLNCLQLAGRQLLPALVTQARQRLTHQQRAGPPRAPSRHMLMSIPMFWGLPAVKGTLKRFMFMCCNVSLHLSLKLMALHKLPGNTQIVVLHGELSIEIVPGQF